MKPTKRELEELATKLKARKYAATNSRQVMRRHALKAGIDPMSLQATSPLTVAWMRSREP